MYVDVDKEYKYSVCDLSETEALLIADMMNMIQYYELEKDAELLAKSLVSKIHQIGRAHV